VTSRVFVYGTLQPGQPRWPLLAPFGIQIGSLARARGALFDTGYGWPAAVFDADAAEEVPGVVVAIRAEMLEEALAGLDEVEGVDGGLFQRVVIDVDDLSCWAYHWLESTEAFHRIQRWPRGGEL
jgi:gamma-glutamylcyclotransferase (GGCT)/AIG2-like uncharacterized protein YtfP